ncbi:MAG: lysophospholipid acyltransferase family protein [Burkholderiaceae bacterium]
MARASLFARSLLFAVLIVIATVIWAIGCFAFLLLPYRQRYWMIIRWNVFICYAAKYVCGIHWHVKGFDNLPDAPVILLSKHQSAWETIFYCWLMPRPLIFVFKKSLLFIPFFGWGLAMLRMIAIDRSRGREAMTQVIETGKQRLNDGQWVIMFPEGTRTPVGSQGKYKNGGAILAIGTDTPVVPIAVNSGDCWPRNAFIKKPGTIVVSIGTPISPQGLSANELMEKVEHWIESEMRVITPGAYAS